MTIAFSIEKKSISTEQQNTTTFFLKKKSNATFKKSNKNSLEQTIRIAKDHIQRIPFRHKINIFEMLHKVMMFLWHKLHISV